jgi:hypothetical protein
MSNPYLTGSETTMGWTLTTSEVPTPSNLTPNTTLTTWAGLTKPPPWGGNSAVTGTTSACWP